MKIIDYQFISILFFLALPICSLGQTADEIIAKHIEAHGGQEKWNAVDALKVTGTFTSFSLEKPYSGIKTRAGAYYGDSYLGERPVIECYTGDFGWCINPWDEMTHARELNGGEENALMQKAEFFTPFLRYKEKGHEVKYLGLEQLDGLDMHVLELTRPNAKKETWYLHAGTYLEYACKSDWVDFGRTLPSAIYFDDFREVEGLVIPFFSDRTFWQRDRMLQVESVEVNPMVDESLFVMPGREEMNVLKRLEGEWDVKVEAYTRTGTWYPMGTTTSSISFESANLLREKITYDRIYRISKAIAYTWHETSGRYRVSVYNGLETSLNLYEGNMLGDTAFVFDDLHIQYPADSTGVREHLQYFIHFGEGEGFVTVRKSSADKGKTWIPKDQFTYTPKSHGAP